MWPFKKPKPEPEAIDLVGECGHSVTMSLEDYERQTNDPIGARLGEGYTWRELGIGHYEVWRVDPTSSAATRRTSAS